MLAYPARFLDYEIARPSVTQRRRDDLSQGSVTSQREGIRRPSRSFSAGDAHRSPRRLSARVSRWFLASLPALRVVGPRLAGKDACSFVSPSQTDGAGGDAIYPLSHCRVLTRDESSAVRDAQLAAARRRSQGDPRNP